MPPYVKLQEEKPEQFDQMVRFLASLKKDMPKEPAGQAAAPKSTAQAPE
jgi:hypothetical protein